MREHSAFHVSSVRKRKKPLQKIPYCHLKTPNNKIINVKGTNKENGKTKKISKKEDNKKPLGVLSKGSRRFKFGWSHHNLWCVFSGKRL